MRFTFGAYRELQQAFWNGYNLEGLLYDAREGLFLSRQLIFEYYHAKVQGKEPVPLPIQEFIAELLHRLANGEIKPDKAYQELLHPLGGRRPSKYMGPGLTDYKTLFCKGGDWEELKEELAAAAPSLCGYSASGHTLAKAARAMQERNERIAAVSDILGRFYSPHTRAEGQQWFDELRAIYKDKRRFDQQPR